MDKTEKEQNPVLPVAETRTNLLVKDGTRSSLRSFSIKLFDPFFRSAVSDSKNVPEEEKWIVPVESGIDPQTIMSEVALAAQILHFPQHSLLVPYSDIGRELEKTLSEEAALVNLCKTHIVIIPQLILSPNFEPQVPKYFEGLSLENERICIKRFSFDEPLPKKYNFAVGIVLKKGERFYVL